MKNLIKALMIMFTIRLGITGKSIADFIIYVQNIIDKMTGNADFPNPDPALDDMQSELDKLNSLQEKAQKGSKEDTLKRDQQYQKMKKKVTKLGAFVEWKSDGDPVKIASTGFETRSDKTPGGDLPAPAGVAAKSKVSTKVVITFNKVPKRRTYVIQMAQSANGPWTDVGKTGKLKFTVSNLSSGRQYWFRVYAVGVKGDSPYSDVATTFVL